MPAVLILFSSPDDADRLRLDREHKRVESAVAIATGTQHAVDRRHAATLDDMARALSSRQFDIIHFSGHGAPEGFYFDTESDGGRLVSPKQFTKVVQATQPSLSALLMMSCYSADTALQLLPAAPYVISVVGSADDEATIDFVGQFYERYFKTGSIEQAFRLAIAVVDGRLDAVLGRRPDSNPSEPTIVVHPEYKSDPIYVNYAEARETISRLNIPQDKFLSILSRKLRVHQWIFEGERENAILPIAGYFAKFSWTNAKACVRCHWVYKPKSGLSEAACEAIAGLIVSYNDVYVGAYRRSRKPVAEQDPRYFKHALEELHRLVNFYLKDTGRYSTLEQIDPDNIRMLRANCWANLSKADEKIASGDYSSAAIFAETALSAVHDAIEGLVEAVSE